jgi:hypothetical protein
MPPTPTPAATFLDAAPQVGRRQKRGGPTGTVTVLPRRPAPPPRFVEATAPPPAPEPTLSGYCAGGEHRRCPARVLLIPPRNGQRYARCECGTCKHRGRGRIPRAERP